MEMTNYLGDLVISGKKNMDIKEGGHKDLGFTQLIQECAQLLELSGYIL
jgi:hypothetical protein